MANSSKSIFAFSLAGVLIIGLASGFGLSNLIKPASKPLSEIPAHLIDRMSALETVTKNLQNNLANLNLASQSGTSNNVTTAASSAGDNNETTSVDGFGNRIDSIVASISELDQRLARIEFDSPPAAAPGIADLGDLPQPGASADFSRDTSMASSLEPDLVSSGAEAMESAVFSDASDDRYSSRLNEKIGSMFVHNPTWSTSASFDTAFCSKSACKVEITFAAGLDSELREEIQRGIFATLASDMASGQTVYEPLGDGSEKLTAYLGR